MVQLDAPQTQPDRDEQHGQVTRRIYRATGALMLLQIVIRAFGLIQKIIMSHYFGTGAEANAYSVATKITAPILALGDQVIMHSFLPTFVQRMRERGERDAWRMASTCINIMILVMAVIAVVGLAFTADIFNLFAHDWMVKNTGSSLASKAFIAIVMIILWPAMALITYALSNIYKHRPLPLNSVFNAVGYVATIPFPRSKITIPIASIFKMIAIISAVFFVRALLVGSPVLINFEHHWMLTSADPSLTNTALHLTRVLLVAMIFLAISSFTYCLLNSYKQFALPASSDLALKATVLIFAILFAHQWGAYALAVGFVFGAIAKVGVQAIGLGKRITHYRPVIDLKDSSVRQFAWLALPLIIGWAFSTFRAGMEVRFLTHIADTGNTSAYDYAKSITDLPVTFFPYAFGIALFPFLADIAASGDKERMRAMLMTATRMMMLIFVPLAIALILLRYPIVQALYGSSKFQQHSADLTTAPLQILAIMMLVAALEIIVNQFYFAMSDTVRPTVVGMVLLPVYAVIGYLGVYTMGWGAIAIALALLAYRSAKVVTLYAMIREKLGDLPIGQLWKLLGQMAMALIPFVIILFGAVHVLHGHAHHVAHATHTALASAHPAKAHSKLKELLALFPYIAATGLGLLCYCAVLQFLHVEEMALIVGKVRGKLQRT